MPGSFILELNDPAVVTSSTDRRRFSLTPDGPGLSQGRRARRQRVAPYPPQSPATARSPRPFHQVSTGESLNDLRSQDNSGSANATRDTKPRLARSESGTVYTLLPHPTHTQGHHRSLGDAEELRPGPSGDRPPSPVVNVDVHEDVSTNDINGAAQQVLATAVGSLTSQGDAPAAGGDDGVAAIARKVLEYCKKADITSGIESETGEGVERDPPPQDEEVGPERRYEDLKVVRLTRAFHSSSGQGETVWWISSSPTPIDCPPSKVEPELGDLYIHRTLDGSSTQIWLAYEPLSWTSLEVEYVENYLPDRVIKGTRHPTFHDRLLKLWKNGEPSWVTQASCATLKSRYKE